MGTGLAVGASRVLFSVQVNVWCVVDCDEARIDLRIETQGLTRSLRLHIFDET